MPRDFSKLLIDRRSTRHFSTQKLTSEETASILQAALLAPTSKNTHSWEFVVVENSEMLQKLSVAKPHGGSFIAEAALAVVVMGDPLASDVWIEDAAIASFAMQMQAEALHVGSCWVQIRAREFSETIMASDYVRDLLDVPMPLQVLSIIAFGKKIKTRQPNNVDKLLWEKIHIEKFNAQ